MPGLPTAFVQTKTPAPRAVVEKPSPTVRVAYAVTIFLSAFLLFQVQLIATKFILPWFGGSPAVFTASMLFFQAGLVAGYTYANKLIHHCNLKTQKRVHLLILLLSIAILACRGLQWASPITPGVAWKPSVGDSPVWHILKVLGASVGVPYFTLSITVPLLQGWLGRSYRGVSPYRFYSLSNVGSALALLSYPFFIEPLLGLRTQAWVWSVGFFIFACSCALVALGLSAKVVEPSGPTLQRNGFGRENNPPPPPQDKLLWALLAAGGSVMMLATTNQICQGIAVIPLLWVLPLSIYLFSFVLCFDSARWYSRRWWTLVLSLATGATCFALYSPLFDVLGQIAIYSLLLFACCMVFHGELARSKPQPSYLTSFYVMIAIGGAAGGVFVTVIAPMIFKQYWELHLGLWSCWLLLTIVLLQAENSWIYHARPYWLLSMVIIFPAGGVLLAEREYLGRHAALVTLLSVLLLLVLIGDLRSSRARLRPRRVRFRLVNALMLLAAILGLNAVSYLRQARAVFRNFYGTVVLLDEDRQRPDLERYVLVHGPIIHGLQFRAASKRSIPTTYYGPESGIGLSLLHHPVRLVGSRPMRIGVIGLGVGTVAAYGQPGDYIRFYEINPEIIRLAQTQFTFLKDSKAHIDIVPGDARLSLEGELSRNEMQRFDILALDAFSGDTIPVHLLTSEAFRAYITHLAPDGILAVHLSNRAVDLRPVVKTLAQHFSQKAIWIPSRGDGFVTNESSWMVLAQNKKTLDATALHVATVPYSATNGRLWTDNYSNMLEIVRRAEISF